MDRGFQNTGNNARILDRVGVPPVFRMNMERLAEEPLLSPKTEFATAQWTYARKGNDGGPLPQAIAHRGFKVKKPENTMAAFKAAIEVGAHAIETDIHLSKDNVVVLSHVCPPQHLFEVEEDVMNSRIKTSNAALGTRGTLSLATGMN